MWVYNQRRDKKKGKLPADREAKLQQLADEGAFQWSIHDAHIIVGWDYNFKLLLEYRVKHGHCNVPQSVPGISLCHRLLSFVVMLYDVRRSMCNMCAVI